MVAAVLFDNDGVLVDTEHFYFDTTRAALARLGVELGEPEFVAMSLRDGRSCFDLAYARGLDPTRIEAERAWRNERYSERLLAGVPLLPGVLDALSALRAHTRLALVTSSRPDHLSLQHARTGALAHFETIVTGADVVRHKPDPEPYLMAASRLGVAPVDCLVVEDTERGVAAALAAGMRCAAIPCGYTRGLRFESAHWVLGSIAELSALVRAL